MSSIFVTLGSGGLFRVRKRFRRRRRSNFTFGAKRHAVTQYNLNSNESFLFFLTSYSRETDATALDEYVRQPVVCPAGTRTRDPLLHTTNLWLFTGFARASD